MSNDYRISNAVLEAALNAIKLNADRHGDTHYSFTAIAQMWTVYLEHLIHIRGKLDLTGFDVAQMMTDVKKVRALYGHSIDNHVDQAGYSALAAMLHPLNKMNTEGDETEEIEKKDDTTVQDERGARSS
jgi:Domain of unknown function (DUF6378)